MIERYLFRARTRKDGNLITGSFINGKVPCIKVGKIGEHIPIDIDTLQQCTGVRDKYGNFIFEGDVVEFESGVDFAFYMSEYKVMWIKSGWAFVQQDVTVPNIIYFQNDKSSKLIECVNVIKR